MNENFKNFDKLWQELYNTDEVKECERIELKNKKNTKIFLLLLIIISIVLYSSFIINPIITIIICFAIILAYIIKNRNLNNKMHPTYVKYLELVKKSIKIPVLNNIFGTAKYFDNKMITDEEYRIGFRTFNESRENFESENLMTSQLNLSNGVVTNYKISTVTHGNSAGKDNIEEKIICGDVAIIDLPINLDNSIILESKRKFYTNLFKSFDKIYTIRTENNTKVEQIITEENKNKILELVNKYKCIFEISITKNKLYIRFNGLEVIGNCRTFGKGKDDVKKFYYGLLMIKDISVSLSNMIIKTIGDKI